MAIFVVIDSEAIVQDSDKTRINAARSFVSGSNTVAQIQIKPYAGTSFVDVTENGYLDWAYTHSGGEDDPETLTIAVKVTDSGGSSKTVTKTIQVVTEATDRLFATDDLLRKHDSNIMNYLPDGRSSFKDVHRRAQTLILAWLDREGYIDNYGDKIVLDDLVDIEEFREWAAFVALRLIYEGVSNAVDDIFQDKAKKYKGMEIFYRGRATVKIDLSNLGLASQATVQERLDIRSCPVVRR